MSDNSTLLKSCRYYKGEDQNPFEGKDQNKSMLWFYESVWVNSSKSSVDDSILASMWDLDWGILKNMTIYQFRLKRYYSTDMPKARSQWQVR